MAQIKILQFFTQIYWPRYRRFMLQVIIAVDFNLIMDKGLESVNYNNINNPKARLEIFNLIKKTFYLKDVNWGKTLFMEEKDTY